MSVKPYEVAFLTPPPPIEGMAYWKRLYEVPGWVCVWPDDTYGEIVRDGVQHNIIPFFEYVRRRKDGALICVPIPRSVTQAIASAPHMGELIRVEPDFEKVLEVCRKGDAMYVLLPSKVWPDFQESKLAQAVYDANTHMSTLLKGYMGTLHETPTWSEIYAAPANQLLDGNVWIIRRNRPETEWTYFVDATMPPPPSEMAFYWERGEGVHDGFTMLGWSSINSQGTVVSHIMDGTEYNGALPIHEYELLMEPDGETLLGVLKPRTISEAFDYAPLLGDMRSSESTVAMFIRECKRKDVKYVMINNLLWSELLHNMMDRKIMDVFVSSTQETRLRTGLMGHFRDVAVWSDAYCMAEDKVVGNQIWACSTEERWSS